MMLTARIGFIVGILAIPSFLQAQTIPGRWEKVDQLPPGSNITITLTTGQKITAAFCGAQTDFLTVTIDSTEMKVPKADVQTIARTANDRLRNGVLIGTGVGFAAGFLSLVSFNAHVTASGPIWDREGVGYYIGAGLIGAGIGAVTGLMIDSARKTTEIIYSR